MIASQLDKAIRAVCPIDGVSIGRADDKKTWRIDFKDEATKDERDAAQAVLAGFDPDAPENRPAPPRDLIAALDELQTQSAALTSALIKKGTLSAEDIEAEKRAETGRAAR